MPLAYCVAVYILGVRYHSGQWSKGYRIQCQAGAYISREYGRSFGLLWARTLVNRHSEFRNEVAYYLKVLRKHRHSL